jgi:hypothetical protein
MTAVFLATARAPTIRLSSPRFDRLNPPSIPEAAVLERMGRGVLDAPLKAGHDSGVEGRNSGVEGRNSGAGGDSNARHFAR